MEKLEQFFLSKDGSTHIHMVTFSPQNKPCAIVQITHGITEHIMRYEKLAKYLTDYNILVVGIDLLGHGLSTNNNTKKMYFGPSGSWNYVLQDIDTCYQMTKEKYPDIPYIMLGFSLGSFLIRNYLITYPNKVAGSILIGTGYTSPFLLKMVLKITLKEIKKYGEETITPKINNLAFGTYNKNFKPTKTTFDWLYKSPKALEKYLADPLRGEGTSSGLFRELLNGMIYDNSSSNITKMNKNTPILILSGSADAVGDFTKGVTKFYNVLKKYNFSHLKLKIYPSLRHDILHEDEYLEVYNDILSWLDSTYSLKIFK